MSVILCMNLQIYPDAHITHQGFAFRGFVSLLVDNRQLRTDFFVNHVAVFVVHVTDLAEE